MDAWKTMLVCTLAVLVPTLTACTMDGAVAGGMAGHETTHNTVGTTGGATTGTVIGHELSK